MRRAIILGMEQVLDSAVTLTASAVFRFVLPLIIIVVLALVALRLVQVGGRRAEERFAGPAVEPQRRARLNTLIRTSIHTANAVILVLATMMVLLTIGVDLGPVLAAAGVAGLALSLGAQTIIKDYIGGLLILLEDQFRVGDTIQVADVIGAVESITLRTTQIRDINGRLSIVPNGDIRTVSNLSREWARAVVDLNLSYDTDISRVTPVLEEAMKAAVEDSAIKEDVLGAVDVLGWNSHNDFAVQVRLMVKTAPGKQWAVARVLRRYALAALEANAFQVFIPLDALRRAGN
ncbi:MAG: mechanosensitive ion channel family protein [Anaerolineae bacterium]